MDLFNLQAKIGLDTREYNLGIDDASQKNSKLVSTMGGVSDSSETVQKKITDVSAQYEEAKSKVEELTTAYEKSRKENGETSETTQKLAKKLNDAESEANDLKGELNSLAASSDKTGSSFSGLGDKIKKGLATAAKVGAAAITAAAAGIGALTKQSIDGYANYEQLVGGVETLFKDNADTVIKYAEKAYKESGLSQNQYMETVTSFSASLIQSLGNDTAAAAEYAQTAIVDMSDNANKMGTSMESIQNAYQGFAKQNYTINPLSAA